MCTYPQETVNLSKAAASKMLPASPSKRAAGALQSTDTSAKRLPVVVSAPHTPHTGAVPPPSPRSFSRQPCNGELTESGNISNREDEGFDRAPQQVVGCDQRHGTPPPPAPKTHPTAATARRPDGGEGAGKAGKGARRPQEAERSPRRPASAHARGEPGWLL